LNLLSHDDPFISEQISILLANVSNSPYFRHLFLTDRCMKALIKILRLDRSEMPTEASLLSVLIGVLNLSSIKEIVVGISKMKFQDSLESIVLNNALPKVNKSIALLAISNIYTLSKDPQINNETKEFAFYVLQYWKTIQQEEKEEEEIVTNLVYSALILFYNIVLKRPEQSDTIKKVLSIITDHILVFNDPQIVNVVLEIITLFTRHHQVKNANGLKFIDTSSLLLKNKDVI